jgi:hypothetical protein
MAVDALLHPRATTLPTHVQSTYIQAAMKMFLRACADCNDDQLAEIVGLIRMRLGIYLLSSNIEVQERASTLKNLLHELEILSRNWEEELNALRAQVKDSLINNTDFLETPNSDGSRTMDEKAVAMISKKRGILAAVVAEPFYAVHPKAQKKVPIPEGLDLNVPFNSSAFEKLLATPEPENPMISKVSFLSKISNSNSSNETSQKDALEEARLATILKSSFQSYKDDDEEEDEQPRADGFNSIGGDGQLFYLGRNQSDYAPDISTLSKILGDFEDDRPRRKREKTKKSKGKKKSVDVDVREMVPMGMDDSDEEISSSKKKSSKNKKPSNDVRSIYIFIFKTSLFIFLFQIIAFHLNIGFFT